MDGAGEKSGRLLLLDSSEPSLWYEAAAALPPVQERHTEQDQQFVEQSRQAAEQALEAESSAFEKDFGGTMQALSAPLLQQIILCMRVRRHA
jgi:hypothetical protein